MTAEPDPSTRWTRAVGRVSLEVGLQLHRLDRQAEHVSLEDLAKEVGCDRTYVGRTLRLTSLVPDIIEAILLATNPMVSLEKLRKNLPVRWEEQRERGRTLAPGG